MGVLDTIDTALATGSTPPPTERLAAFLSAVSDAADVAAAMDRAVHGAVEAFAADFALVTRGDINASTSPPPPTIPPTIPQSIVVTLDGTPSGELRVARYAPKFTEDDRELLGSMARVLAMTANLLENREKERSLLVSLRERQDLLDRLARVQRSIYQRAPLAEVLDTICLGAVELLGDDLAGLRLIDDDDPTMLVMVASVGVRPVDTDERNWRTPVGDGAGGRAVAEGQLVVLHDYATFEGRLPVFVSSGVQAAMASPVFEAGRIVGSLTVASRRPGRRYSEAEQDILRAFAEHASLALNDARTADALRRTLGESVHLAFHDPLTGLANRASVIDHLGRLLGTPAGAGPGRALRRRRPVQDGQRLPRPRDGRCRAPRSGPAVAAMHPTRRPRRSTLGRRVRRHRLGPPWRDRCARSGRPHLSRPGPAHFVRRTRPRRHGQHGGGPRRARLHPRTTPPRRRRRHVPGQGAGPRPDRAVRQGHARPAAGAGRD